MARLIEKPKEEHLSYLRSLVITKFTKPIVNTILLDQENNSLNEVVVVGYGYQRKSSLFLSYLETRWVKCRKIFCAKLMLKL